MSIMDKIFGNRTTAAPVQKQPGNFPANPAITSDPNNPAVPNSNENESVKKEPSPLDQFAELFKIDPAKLPKQAEPIFAGLDPAKIAEAAKTNDFTKLVTPEMQASLAKGGTDAVNTMVQVMQAMSQKSFGDSAVASTKLIERALDAQKEEFKKMLPDMIKAHTRNETLTSSNPLFSNPAAAPMLDMISKQVATKYPEATSAEQAKLVQDYALQFAEAANPKKKQAEGTDKVGNKTDWSDFFDEA